MANRRGRSAAGERVSPSQTAAAATPVSSSVPRNKRIDRLMPSVRALCEVTGGLLPTGLDSDYLRGAVLRNDDRIVPVAGVGDRMQHADIGAHAENRDRVGPQCLKPLLQVGAEEAAIAPLW